jgi:hypothetical protein
MTEAVAAYNRPGASAQEKDAAYAQMAANVNPSKLVVGVTGNCKEIAAAMHSSVDQGIPAVAEAGGGLGGGLQAVTSWLSHTSVQSTDAVTSTATGWGPGTTFSVYSFDHIQFGRSSLTTGEPQYVEGQTPDGSETGLYSYPRIGNGTSADGTAWMTLYQ